MHSLKTFFNRLSPISAQSWDKLEALFSPQSLKKGDYFITAGETARDIAFLESGIIRAFYRNSEAVEYNKHFFTRFYNFPRNNF